MRSTSSVVQKVDNAIHRINHYPLDSAIDFANTQYPQDVEGCRFSPVLGRMNATFFHSLDQGFRLSPVAAGRFVRLLTISRLVL